jgi:NAD(P)-dependent dehydrogenase (short-subunit alcohol dehydrogenase family)
MKPERVLITGTTSGVGLALLEHFADRGTKIVCVNRRRVPELEARYPSVSFECVDVRSREQVAALVGGLVERAELPDVFILNAGINRIDNDTAFELDSFQAVMDTNLYGVLNFIQPLTRLAAGRTPRHVVAVSSMAAYVGNPYGLGYHASKRALTACFDVWSKMYVGTDLVFQQVMLGPVHTPIFTMADRLPPWMVRIKALFSVSSEAAARAVAGFAEGRAKKLFYPGKAVPLYLAMWMGQSLTRRFFQGQSTLDGKARRRARQHGTDTHE